MMKKYTESKEYIFYCSPVVEDVALEMGIEDIDAIRAMYEVFKRASNYEKQYDEDSEVYREGYNNGYNDALDEVSGEVDDLSYRVDRLRKG